jgi:hypothetical protein
MLGPTNMEMWIMMLGRRAILTQTIRSDHYRMDRAISTSWSMGQLSQGLCRQAGQSEAAMGVVDAQIHLFLNMDIEACLAAMNSMGIQAALIDDFSGYECEHRLPGYLTSHCVLRPTAPGAMMASMKHPDRFSWLLRIDPHDADFNNIMSSGQIFTAWTSATPGGSNAREIENLADLGCLEFFREAGALWSAGFCPEPGQLQAARSGFSVRPRGRSSNGLLPQPYSNPPNRSIETRF